MVHFTPEQMRAAMDNPLFIRNVTVCAHVDAGKSTTTDALVADSGIIAKKDAGDKCHTDTRIDEQQRGITIKSTGVSMHFVYNADNKWKGKYLINLVDSPGHVDFSSEVTAALRISDGAVVLIDAVDGVCVQTKTVVRQALQEKGRPVLMINKMDRLFLELGLDLVEIYQMLRRHIEDVNVLLASVNDPDLGEIQVDPREDNVLFGSGYHQWGFTLSTFAKMYAPIFKKTEEQMKDFMWGDWFYLPERKVFSKSNKSGTGVPGFVYLVLDPISKLCKDIMDCKPKKVKNKLNRLGVKVPQEDFDLIHTNPKKLCKAAMTRWLPLGKSLLGMIIEKLPSPVEAQKYRAKSLYTGPEDEVYRAMRDCDPEGPVMMYISKMVPLKQGDSRFYAFGRLFSGTIRAGTPMKIMGDEYEFGKKTDLFNAPLQQVVSLMASKVDKMPDIPCGNTCALVGVDKYILKTGTISSHQDAHPIKGMTFSVSPVVRASVTVKKTADLKKLMEGLKKMQATDTIVQVIREESGEIIVAGAGELHLEICLKDLKDFMGGAELVIGDPVVPYRETVTIKSDKCLSKSPNKHNRLWATVEPLPEELCVDIEEGKVKHKPPDEKEQLNYIHSTYGLDKDAFSNKKFWTLGPDSTSANALIEQTVGANYLSEIKEAMNNGFVWGSKSGPLMDEPLRGVRLNLVDITLHADSIHRGMGQIMPPTRKLLLGAVMSAQPRIQEPIFLASITVPQANSGGVYKVLSARRGVIVNSETSPNGQMCTITAHLPVAESFGFDSAMRGATGGTAFSQCSFSHWETMDSDPLVEGTLANEVVKKVRARKGLKELKTADHYLDKL